MLPYVQAITVAIAQYAEKAVGVRDLFLYRRYGVGGSVRGGDVP